MSLKQLATKGLFWNALGQYSSQFLRILLTIILARLLTPAQFGLVAMVTIVSGFSIVLIDFGFRKAIIQKQNVKEIDLHSIFWANTTIGAIITATMFFAAPLFTKFYNEEQLLPLTQIISFTFILSALQIVPSAILAKELDFKRLTIPNVLATFISGAIAIILAASGFGATALAIQLLLGSFFTVIFIYGLTSWRPKFQFSKQSIYSYAGFSFSMSVNSGFHYLANNTDDLLVGKLFGQTQLGLYNKAYAIIHLPADAVTKILTAVFLPYFSKIQDDKNTIARYYLKLTKLVAFISFPFMIFVLFYANQFVLFVFGKQWLAAIPYVKVFTICGMIASINSMIGPVIVSQGRKDLIWREMYLKRPSVLIAVFIGSFFSVFAIVIGKLIADVFNLVVTFYQIRSAISIPIQQQIATLGNIATATLLFISVLIFGEFILPNTILTVIISSLLASVVYFLYVLKFESQLIKQVLSTIMQKFD